jgi:hypothetical protein
MPRLPTKTDGASTGAPALPGRSLDALARQSLGSPTTSFQRKRPAYGMTRWQAVHCTGCVLVVEYHSAVPLPNPAGRSGPCGCYQHLHGPQRPNERFYSCCFVCSLSVLGDSRSTSPATHFSTSRFKTAFRLRSSCLALADAWACNSSLSLTVNACIPSRFCDTNWYHYTREPANCQPRSGVLGHSGMMSGC